MKKKIMITLIIIMIIMTSWTGWNNEIVASAAEPEVTIAELEGISYDLSLYDVNWSESEVIKVKCKKVVWKGGTYLYNKTLGTVKVIIGLATSYRAIQTDKGPVALQRIVMKATMTPNLVSEKVTGMSQDLQVFVNNYDGMNIQFLTPENTPTSTSYTVSTSIEKNANGKVALNSGVNVGVSSNKSVEVGISNQKGADFFGGISSTVTTNEKYTIDAINVYAYKYLEDCSAWDFDYKAINDKNRFDHNKYLFASSDQTGIMGWYTNDVSYIYSRLKIKINAIFGAGNKSTGEVYEVNGSYHIGYSNDSEQNTSWYTEMYNEDTIWAKH